MAVGAMGTSPRAVSSKNSPASNLTRLSPGVYRNAQGQTVNSKGVRIDSRGRPIKVAAPTPKNNPAAPTAPTGPEAPGAPTTPPTWNQLTPEQQFTEIGSGVGQGINQQLGYMQNMGQFNPGTFDQQQKDAYGRVMSQFDMSTSKQFQKEAADFEQMAAERGLDPSGKAYASLKDQMNTRQDTARQQAMMAGQDAANQVQQQAYNQASQTYQMPGAMLGAYSPFFNQMGQQQQLASQFGFDKQKMGIDQQNQLERMKQENKYRLQQIAATPRSGGGGGLSLEQQKDLLMFQSGLNMAERAGQPGPTYPSTGNQFINGVGQALPLAVGGWLK